MSAYGSRLGDMPPPPGSAAATAEERFDELTARVRPRVPHPADWMHVAAVLEADGVTDATARSEYARRGVFGLAGDVYARLAAEAATRTRHTPTPNAERRLSSRRDGLHGLLYLMPATLLPAAIAIVGLGPLSRTLVVASALGWIWSAGSAWLAYRLLSRSMPRSAAVWLRRTALVGVALGALAGALVGWRTTGGWPVIALAAGLLAYQSSVTIALFYRCEHLVFAAIAPAVGATLIVAFTHRPVAASAAIGGACVTLALGVTVWRTTRPLNQPEWPEPRASEPALRTAVRPDLRRLPVIALYAALSAAYLLHVDARYLNSAIGLAVAGAPLIAGMGIVEWRVRRFQERGHALLSAVSYPDEFAFAVWRRLVLELLLTTAALGLLGAALAGGLHLAGQLTAGSVALIAAHVAIGPAWLLAFLVAGHGWHGRLCAAIAVALALHVAITPLMPGGSTALVNGITFLASTLLLAALLITILARDLGQAWRHR